MRRLNIYIAVVLMTLLFSVTIFGEDLTLPRVIDYADLLSSSEEQALTARIEDIVATYEQDIVIVTVNSLNGKSATAYADDFFDNEGYGIGTDDAGILFLIGMDERDWAISTCGRAIQVFSDRRLNIMSDQIVPYLSSGDYHGGLNTFVNLAEKYYATPIEEISYEEAYDDKGMGYLFAVLIGLIGAWSFCWYEKSKMKTAAPVNRATNYITQEGLRLREQKDVFLYSNVIRKKIEQNTSSGSSTHTSSSGQSHGGTSGKF